MNTIDECKHDAEFIVRAVNLRGLLLSALRSVANSTTEDDVRAIAEKAISVAKAEGKVQS